MTSQTDWMTMEETAAWLRIPLEAAREGVGSGEIPALVIAGMTRVSRQGLLDRMAAGQADTRVVNHVAPEDAHRQGLAAPAGLAWMTELHKGEDFSYHWPDKVVRRYHEAWYGEIVLRGKRLPVKIGLHESGSLWGWVGNKSCSFWPTVDCEGWVSLIRHDGRQTLPVGAPLPSLYSGARVRPFREATGKSGRGAPNAQAVIIDRDDLRGAIHYVALRRLA